MLREFCQVPPALQQSPGHCLAGTGTTASITGIVLGAGDRPLRGACVMARSLGRSSAPTNAAAAGLTGADGLYALAGLRPGAYTISYRDCADPGAYFEQWSGGAELVSVARPVLVGPATRIRLAAVRLRPTRQAAFIAAPAARSRHLAMARGRLASVSGTVRNKRGKRQAGVCVFVYPKGNYFAGSGESTGRNGSYSFPGLLPPGRYLVQFTAGCPNGGNYAPQYWKYAAGPGGATVLRLHAGQQVTGVNGRLGRGGELSGTVRAAGTGTPLAGVCVFVTSVRPACTSCALSLLRTAATPLTPWRPAGTSCSSTRNAGTPATTFPSPRAGPCTSPPARLLPAWMSACLPGRRSAVW